MKASAFIDILAPPYAYPERVCQYFKEKIIENPSDNNNKKYYLIPIEEPEDLLID